jgi:peptidoglycan/xylan/chitin deacetylase (PgdA/CDA1 family)
MIGTRLSFTGLKQARRLLSSNMRMKTAARNLLASALYWSGGSLPARHHLHKLSIVTFHRVLPAADKARYPYPGLVVTPDELDTLLGFFKEHFDCQPLGSQYLRFASGEPVTKPLLAVTFDDGQHDNFAYARPVLERHGLKATFFIPVCAIQDNALLWHDQLGFALQELMTTPAGRRRAEAALVAAGIPAPAGQPLVVAAVRGAKLIPRARRLELVGELVSKTTNFAPPAFARMMTDAEIRMMADEGHEIGSHSMTHCLMPECSDSELAYEAGESARVLALMTGRPVHSFCYPNGDADERCIQAVAAAGYRCAVTTAHGNNQRHDAPFSLSRFDMDPARMTNSAGEITTAGIAFRMLPRARQ